MRVTSAAARITSKGGSSNNNIRSGGAATDETTTNEQLNLSAVQNLNAYLDAIQSIAEGKQKRQQQNRDGSTDDVVEIEFALVGQQHHDRDPSSLRRSLKGKKKKKSVGDYDDESVPFASRRKVQLTWPPPEPYLTSQNHRQQQLRRQQVVRHASGQLVKLLRAAGLEPPPMSLDTEWENEIQYELSDYGGDDERRRRYRTNRTVLDEASRRRRVYDASRERFAARIDPAGLRAAYRRAVADMNADIATSGQLRNARGRRRKLVANLLAKVSIEKVEEQSKKDKEGGGAATTVDAYEHLIALRRLSLILDDHYDELHLEEFGSYWENCDIVLGPARRRGWRKDLRTSRRRGGGGGGDNGFCFTLRPDNRVTIRIPVDFRDDELICELDRNLWDFYDIVGDGMDEIFRNDSVA